VVRNLFLVLAALLILGTVEGCGIKGEPQPTHMAAPAPSPTIYIPPTFPPTWTPYPPTPTNTRVIPIPPTHTPGPSPTPTRFPTRTKAMVISIQDSRTFEVLIEGQSLNQVFRVRLLGVEAPLLSDPWNEVALDWLVHELEHQVVILESGEWDRDTQGNLLRYVWKEGRMVNVAMVQLGLAIASENANTLNFGADLLDAQSNAQNADRGLWGPPPTATPTPLVVTPTITATESYTPGLSTPTTPQPTGATGRRDGQKTTHIGAQTQNVELVGHIGGTIGAVFVQDSYTYVGIGPELAILDTADPAQAARLGYLVLPDMVKDITVIP
jgi:endonuclease YncB( thermonuclease family)